MSLIDNKGRLFGVVNIFDLFVLCVLSSMIFFAFKWARIADDPEWMKIKLFSTRCVGIVRLPAYIAKLVKEGDEGKWSDGVVAARIVKIISYEKEESAYIEVPVFFSKTGEKLVMETIKKENDKYEDEVITLVLLVDVTCYNKKGVVYCYTTSEPLRIGTNVTSSTEDYNFTVNIRKILDKPEGPL